MTFDQKAFVWALASTVAAFSLFWAYYHANNESADLARDLYAVCAAVERNAPELLADRPMPTGPEQYTPEYEAWLVNERRIIEACEAHPERFEAIEARTARRAKGQESNTAPAGSR